MVYVASIMDSNEVILYSLHYHWNVSADVIQHALCYYETLTNDYEH